MIILNMEQGTPEWHQARCGIPSASVFDCIVTSKGVKTSDSVYERLLYKLAGERISGVVEPTYSNGAMEWGKTCEPEARQWYEFQEGVTVEQVGFCFQNETKRWGCSPDGLVGDDGLVEIKCPQLPTMAKYLYTAKEKAGKAWIPTDYIQQIQGQMMVTGRKWCDFFAYHLQTPPLLVRVYRDEAFISLLEAELLEFCDRLDNVVKTIRGVV